MKSSLKQLAIGALGLASASLSFADTINIVGSNGDRQATQTAIAHILGRNNNTWTFQGVTGYASGTGGSGTVSSVPTGSNYGVWNGTFNGTPVVIKVSFIGAAGAVAAVAGSLNAPFCVPNTPANTGNLPDPTTGDHVVAFRTLVSRPTSRARRPSTASIRGINTLDSMRLRSEFPRCSSSPAPVSRLLRRI